MNLAFAGIISDVQHRVSKAGKGWAMFIIEDYGDSHEFRIFGEDYLKMKHFLVPNSFLFVRSTIQPGWTNKETGVAGEPRLKFTEMKLLHDIMDDLCKKVTIQIPLLDIKEDTILNLETILKNTPGKQGLNFTIWDEKEKIEVSLPSRNTKIHITNELIATLESQQKNYKIN
jgi:DNA polymerase-3 subunit alpha